MGTADSFKPYRAPCAGDGPIDRPARDICYRLGTGDMVTPQVVGIAAWFLQWADLNRRAQKRFLDDLGLEEFEQPMGGTVLRPIEKYRR